MAVKAKASKKDAFSHLNREWDCKRCRGVKDV